MIVTEREKYINPNSARGQGGLWVGGAFALDVALAAQRATSVRHPKPQTPRWTQVASKTSQDGPKDGPDKAQDRPKVDPSNPKVLPRSPQGGINLAQNAHPTACNIQPASHILGPAECAAAIEYLIT